MSLRNSAHLTSESLEANRQNAAQSTGPRTPAGKERSRLNALRHGCYALSAETFRASMRALGEDPAEYDRLLESLLDGYGPADALGARQVEDLAKLYWRRARLERAQEALLWREMERADVADQRHQREAEIASWPELEPEAIETFLQPSADPVTALQQQLAMLRLARSMAARGEISERLKVLVLAFYRGQENAREYFIQYLMHRFAQGRSCTDSDGEQALKNLLDLLDQEIERVRGELATRREEEQRLAAAERAARLAPAGEQWELLLQQQNALDRAIDRKVRILIQLERLGRAGQAPYQNGTGQAAASDSSGGADLAEEPATNEPALAGVAADARKQKLRERSRNVIENKRAASEGLARDAGKMSKVGDPHKAPRSLTETLEAKPAVSFAPEEPTPGKRAGEVRAP